MPPLIGVSTWGGGSFASRENLNSSWPAHSGCKYSSCVKSLQKSLSNCLHRIHQNKKQTHVRHFSRPLFWGRKWLREFSGAWGFCSFCWRTPVPIKFLVLGGGGQKCQNSTRSSLAHKKQRNYCNLCAPPSKLLRFPLQGSSLESPDLGWSVTQHFLGQMHLKPSFSLSAPNSHIAVSQWIFTAGEVSQGVFAVEIIFAQFHRRCSNPLLLAIFDRREIVHLGPRTIARLFRERQNLPPQLQRFAILLNSKSSRNRF